MHRIVFEIATEQPAAGKTGRTLPDCHFGSNVRDDPFRIFLPKMLLAAHFLVHFTAQLGGADKTSPSGCNWYTQESGRCLSG